MTSGQQRLITGLIAGAVVILAIFWAPSDVFFALILVPFAWAAREYAVIARNWAPTAPLGLLVPFVVAVAVGLFALFRADESAEASVPWTLLAGGLALVLGAVFSALLSRAEVKDAVAAMGVFAFGVPYFAIPVACVYIVQRSDPWLGLLLALIVALGDTFAYYVGSKIGRHKIAPVISPNKSWEGSIAGFLAGQMIAVIWCFGRLGEVRLEILAIAAATAVLAQCGDLIESLIKRSAGVKDSSRILPGHGGFYDRFDAIILAAPTFTVGAWLLGLVR